jgi:Nitrogenase molybdenum-iron protein, alpha and beta chains
MSLCRYLPTPSERMATMWSLLPIKDAIVLEYGPAGTTHYSMSLFGSLGVEPDQSLFTTHLSEDDVIMGEVTRLEESILELDKSHHPKVIFVMASAVVAVIGTDIKGVCAYMQEKVKARLIPMEQAGFKGDYTIGLKESYYMLADKIVCSPVTKEKATYNILGASAGSYRIRSDVWELQDLMSQAFGWTCGQIFGLEGDIEGLEQAASAELNLVIRKEALPAAKHLKEKYGIDYIYQAPYGYSQTLTWLTNISEKINCQVNEKVIARIQKKAKTVMQYKMYAMMYKRRPKAVVVGDYDLLLGFKAICDEIGVKMESMICSHSLKGIEELPKEMIYYTTEKERIKRLKELDYHLLFGDDISIHIASSTNTTLSVSFPFVNQVQIAEHLPLMGERGCDYILETVEKYFKTLGSGM